MIRLCDILFPIIHRRKEMQSRKILIIGCPGSGKSTFARKLHAATGLPLVHLDMLYWNEDKTTVPETEFMRRLDAALEQDAWIIDGNYASTLKNRMEKCDRVYLLDYPADVCLEGLYSRMNRPRPDMPWIETEYDAEFIAFAAGFRKRILPGMLEVLNSFPGKEIIVFRSRREADQYLNE